MKYLVLIVLLISTSLSFAQTMREKKIRVEMVNRVDLLTTRTAEAREALAKQDVVKACERIRDMFDIYPEHVEAIGAYMDMFEGKVIEIRNEALAQLIYIHKQSLVCKQGRDAEYLDMGAVDKQLKAIQKSLKKQRKVILKKDTDQDNSFHYEYQF